MVEISSFLKQLVSLPGLSSGEDPVREVLARAWEPLTDEMHVSATGSLHALKRGSGPEPRPNLLVTAHMDAIGLMVTRIEAGLLRFTQVGGLDDRILPGQLVTIHSASGDLPGVIIQPPDSLLPPENKNKPVKMQMLFIDTGLLSEDVEKSVRVGDLISFAQEPVELSSSDIIAGHTMDNRVCVAALTVCLDRLNRMKHSWDIWAAATVQEEETFLGGITSAFQLKPDLAIVMDVTFAKSHGMSDYRTFPLGKGLALAQGPAMHPLLHQDFKKLADQLDIPIKLDIAPTYSGTETDVVQISAAGIPTITVGMPIRYMHTPVEMASLTDIDRLGRLVAEFAASREPDYLKNLADYYYRAPENRKGDAA